MTKCGTGDVGTGTKDVGREDACGDVACRTRGRAGTRERGT